MRRYLDSLLNSITMYRLLVYGLGLLALVAAIFSIGGVLADPIWSFAASAAILCGVSYVVNRYLGWSWHVPTNTESWLITALILFFILPPATTVERAGWLAVAAIVATASKFMLARHRKHVFNPAALAAAGLTITGAMGATWWIGSSYLWPFVLVLGLLVVRKIRREFLLVWFVGASVITAAAVTAVNGGNTVEMMKLLVTTSPLIFLGTIMLTEPATMPATRRQQVVFAILVGVLSQLHVGSGVYFIYPEVALLLGNIYAYIVSPSYQYRLELLQATAVSERVRDFVFRPDHALAFEPGQYMEWTLPGVPLDSRGNRRMFTIASAPSEAEVHVGVKFYDPSSAYKKILKDMKPGDYIYAGQVAGHFTLPKETQKKLLFIAGGIGITPFRSMVKAVLASGVQRDIILLYLVSDASEVAYADVWREAAGHGVRTLVFTDKGELNLQEVLAKHAPDITAREVYISGPNAMVEKTKKMLKGMSVSRSRIHEDYFSGY